MWLFSSTRSSLHYKQTNKHNKHHKQKQQTSTEKSTNQSVCDCSAPTGAFYIRFKLRCYPLLQCTRSRFARSVLDHAPGMQEQQLICFPSCAKKANYWRVLFSKQTPKSGSISRLADIQRVEMCKACNSCQHICTAVEWIVHVSFAHHNVQ